MVLQKSFGKQGSESEIALSEVNVLWFFDRDRKNSLVAIYIPEILELLSGIAFASHA